ncbi:MAG: tautomerase family protein [Oceanobacter sp.]
MPIATIHVPESLLTEENSKAIATGACEIFAEALGAPLDRVRCFVNSYSDSGVFCGGAVVSDGGDPAPFYTFYVLADRTAELVTAMHEAFAALLAEKLNVDKSTIRGACQRITPEDWAIGGVPAAIARKAELDARK